MFKTIKDLFSANVVNDKPDQHQLKVAAATLMFELIRSDGDIDPNELSSLNQILEKEFGLNESERSLLTEQAQQSAEQSISLQGFTREICNQWGHEQRIKLLEYLWILAFADNHIDTHERHLIRKVAGLLYLNDKEIIIAKENAKHKSN